MSARLQLLAWIVKEAAVPAPATQRSQQVTPAMAQNPELTRQRLIKDNPRLAQGQKPLMMASGGVPGQKMTPLVGDPEEQRQKLLQLNPRLGNQQRQQMAGSKSMDTSTVAKLDPYTQVAPEYASNVTGTVGNWVNAGVSYAQDPAGYRRKQMESMIGGTPEEVARKMGAAGAGGARDQMNDWWEKNKGKILGIGGAAYASAVAPGWLGLLSQQRDQEMGQNVYNMRQEYNGMPSVSAPAAPSYYQPLRGGQFQAG